MTAHQALERLREKFPTTFIGITASLNSHTDGRGGINPTTAEISVWIAQHDTHHRAGTVEEATEKALNYQKPTESTSPEAINNTVEIIGEISNTKPQLQSA